MNIIPWRRKRDEIEVGSQPEFSPARLRNEMDSLFDRFFRDPFDLGWFDDRSGALAALPRTDLVETDNDVKVSVELPGVDPKDVEINIIGDRLTVRGEKRQSREEKRPDYRYVERQFGSFQRTVQLPSTIDPDKVEATHANGVLMITIAKHPDAKPRKIKVREA